MSLNVLNNPLVPQPTAPYGISKHAKTYLSALKSGLEGVISAQNSNNATLNTAISNEASARQSAIAAEASARQTAIAAETTARTAAVAGVQSNLDAAKAELSASLSTLEANVNAGATGLDARILDLEQFRLNNTDEIATEVDKAINAKVDDTLFQSVKTALESADTQFSQDLASAISNRENKDVEHDNKLAKVQEFINQLLTTYEMYDANGVLINSFSLDSTATSGGDQAVQEPTTEAPADEPVAEKMTLTYTSGNLQMVNNTSTDGMVYVNFYEGDETVVDAQTNFINFSVSANGETNFGFTDTDQLIIVVYESVGFEPSGSELQRYKLIDGVLTQL